ncbi:type I-F CRISPR-associated helicase Cas3 [Pseudoxanthomonas broegbernensis]|uniref:Type I-F CRISPR-associated helicase Cas3 n=1 Tax=Pseudoxanthomonas broegbernensis TaxID=83619 RepID=A0A7V8K7N3_9GAMM|nr:type I-F CRISPR-associated helicase Cas3f [Pseudoxanthomonas broegbernensis]KAF1687313.1 type I-F CRISPR-associated helicase Cas3 [Pseudoxanthomonas broegbernensis]MBB6065689.1 CRISPR-associated endonuclease/helicase Cas3 [Pseudoxanthomonas broegbernensis]
MNILLISQCDKRALTETRRILDQFAERRGDRTWQTPITQSGLDTLRKLLRRTARKNTAVACHWIRGQDHSELLWLVGDARRFNAEGAVPTDTTVRNVLRAGDENDWHTAEDIRLLAQLAALLHDLGKASLAFQARLRGELQERNLYRHEWVSLRLFLAFVGQDDDEGWLQRLADPEIFDEQAWIASDRYQRDGLGAIDRYPFRDLPPLAAAVAWLVLTHHRLPLAPVAREDGSQDWLGKRYPGSVTGWLESPLARVAHDWNEIRQEAERSRIEPYWQPAGPLPVIEPKWRAQAARLARSLLGLRLRRGNDWLRNPYVVHLARLSLMLADHHYSSLPPGSPLRVQGDGNTRLYANTGRDGRLKQPLDEHLLGVARDAGLIAHALPGFERHLPRLANHRGLRKRSADPRFSWQDKAADAATALREAAREHGAFVVNMASTGCGKTLANARILHALADPQRGMRATFALGLRTLTLQTGRSYRNDLHLGEDELAIRVGGSASRALFEYYEQKAEAHGSASVQDLIEEDSHVLYEGVVTDHPLLSRALHDPNIRSLLSAPMLACTVDHMVPATEALRAGRQIAPMLRLMSADLVLDELDDYDLDDLPALTRLVHWAGMLGTRVVLSSATLPPALVEGMFLAYRAGRIQYRRNRGAHGGAHAGPIEVPCLWADEFGAQTASCANAEVFSGRHAQFVDKRVVKLKKAGPFRRAELFPLLIAKGVPGAQIRAEFAGHVRTACLQLHADHAEIDPVSGKQVSFGLVRMANIEPLFDVARGLFALGAPEGTRIHLCVYHARFPLLQRSAIEHQLDTALNRRGDGQAVYHLPSIRAALDAHPEHDHLFVVLASPVCEVGRDWDADWAVAEPSSMRSLIQLAGRVQRHRGKCGDGPNIRVFDRNLKAAEGRTFPGGEPSPVFVRPGFERQDDSRRFRLRSPRLDKLLSPDEYRTLTAIPRIRPRPQSEWSSRERLVDLEHARMAAGMLPRRRMAASGALDDDAPIERDEATWSWQYPQAALTGVLPQQQPFREDTMRKTTLVFLPDDDEERLVLHRVEQDPARRGQSLHVAIDRSQCHDVRLDVGERIKAWGKFELMALLAEQADALDIPLDAAAKKFAVVQVPESTQGWNWHPWLGFGKA